MNLRHLAHVMIARAGGASALAACSGLNPTPPDPHDETDDAGQLAADVASATIIDPNPGNPHAASP